MTAARTPSETDATLLHTYEAHHVASQAVEVWQQPDGTLTVEAGPTTWTENPWNESESTYDLGNDNGEYLTVGQIAAQLAEELHANGTAVQGGMKALDAAALEVACGDPIDLAKAHQALAGLRELHAYIEGDQEPSAADTCQALYALLGDLGLVVS